MRKRTRRVAALAALGACIPGALAHATQQADIEALQRAVARLAEQNREMQQTIQELREEVRRTRDEALAAREEVRENPPVAASPPPVSAAGDGALLSGQLGRASFQLLDVSLDALVAVGSSTESGGNLELLQAGGHDPRRRGFTLQQVELSLLGAVDPYLDAEAHLIYFLSPGGESRFEIEEAFATSRALPFGAEGLGLQVQAGHFFTEFGRINPQHPHQWDWQDQPLVSSRFFGADGMRGPGLRLGWLTPLPWFSEIHLGVQNCNGETMVSFCANDEVFAERPIGGRPFVDAGVSSAGDFAWLARWVNAFDLGDTWSSQIGVSSLFGQNASGGSGFTSVAGGDLVLKWRPLSSDRGWPFLVFQAEAMGRWYDAASFTGCPVASCNAPVFVPGGLLEDWGLYAQMLWGFRRNWAVGLRGELATGSGSNVGFDDDGMGNVSLVPVRRNDDPFRGDRQRISPLLVFQPTEFSRLRLQYNYDHARFLPGDDAHSVWAGLEFLFGSHPAHAY